MECPRSWTFVAFIIYLSFKDYALSENVAPETGMVRENRECTKLHELPSTADLFNSILANAANNVVLPDLIPMLQGQPIVESLHKLPYPQEKLTKPLSVVPMPTGINAQQPIFFSSQPIKPPASNQNLLFATPLPCGSSYPSNIIPTIPQTISPPAVPPSNCISQITQALPLENYPACAPNVGAVQPMPIVLQPSQFNEVNSYNSYNQIVEPISLPEVSAKPLNLPVLSTPQILPPINTCSGNVEIIPNLSSPCPSQPTVITTECQQIPMNLQFNVPTASVPAPKITVVSANPTNSPVSLPVPYYPEYPAVLPNLPYPPQPPIILGGSKSSLRKWLPILLVALLSDRGCNNDGGGCCRCCCSCNGGSGNNIPIPYPIPIPVNNPIINTCSNPYSCRNREYGDDGNDDDDW